MRVFYACSYERDVSLVEEFLAMCEVADRLGVALDFRTVGTGRRTVWGMTGTGVYAYAWNG